MTATRVFHLDTGGCGACALEVWATVETSPELQWASSPLHADVVALTGSLTAATRDLVLTIYRDYLVGRVPIVAIGRCAIDGYPYGKGDATAGPLCGMEGWVHWLLTGLAADESPEGCIRRLPSLTG